MSPIFVRPAREQHEHDRLIRYLHRTLQAKDKKSLDIHINPGDEQTAAVKVGDVTYFPDLVLAEGKKLDSIIEIETGESVNNLEAMHQWAPFSRSKVPFLLYVPVTGYEAARRLMDANHARVTEIWTYRVANDAFDLVQMHNDPAAVSAGKGSKAVLVPIAPKPVVVPPPPPEPPPVVVKAPEPKPVKVAAKGSKGKAAVAAPPTPPPAPVKGAAAKAVATSAKAAAPAGKPSSAPAKPAAKPVAAKAAAPVAKPAAKPAVKPAAKAKPAAKPVAKPAVKKPVKAAKPAPAKKKAAPPPAKKKGSAGKKGR